MAEGETKRFYGVKRHYDGNRPTLEWLEAYYDPTAEGEGKYRHWRLDYFSWSYPRSVGLKHEVSQDAAQECCFETPREAWEAFQADVAESIATEQGRIRVATELLGWVDGVIAQGDFVEREPA